ncbi:hypothetical protein COLO4_15716 [Corchorus olitorius]|uniref:F-box domain-containing protein n=1 Tax=Corchorus olitorius TaxID=93759 RepID=A0A1R3JLJ5_9ROSI|nr:hypothetical protein COLO4_15716 [Corchorus olitorius]
MRKKSPAVKKRNRTIWEHWPIDIINNILCQLPAKCLIRYKSVSKEWNALITQDSYFINSHLQQQAANDISLILVDRERSNCLYSVDLYSFDSFDTVASCLKLPTNITEVVGSCNGLILALAKSETHKDHLLLCNISTQEYKILPNPLPSKISGFYGFGYDSINDDYKILRIQHEQSLYPHAPIYKTQVYSLRGNTWREVRGKNPYRICIRVQPRALNSSINGAVHWLGVNSICPPLYATLIVAFDLGTGNSRKVPLLEGMIGGRMCLRTLGILGGCLCVTTCPCDFLSCSELDFWVMEDYMVKESWTKLFTIVQHGKSPLKPLAYDDELVLIQENGDVFWYDYETKEKFEANHGLSELGNRFKLQGVICSRTLVSLSAYGDAVIETPATSNHNKRIKAC